MKTQAITLMKEDVLALGRMVSGSVAQLTKVLSRDTSADLKLIEDQEEKINQACLKIEEKCLDLLNERNDLNAQEIRTLVGSTLMAAKFERLADHVHRVAKLVSWAEEDIEIPAELAEMCSIIHHMVEDVLLCFLQDAVEKVPAIMQRDNHVNYLHDVLSKKLLSHLGEQDQEQAQTRAQFLFCARYLERMGDGCSSIAKRIHFIVTGERLKND